jgi:hypothetical protein
MMSRGSGISEAKSMSFWTGASDALERALVEREVQKRQAMLDALKALQEAQEARVAGDSKRNFEALEHEREGDRVAREVEYDMPDDALDAASVERRRKHGYGGSVRVIPGVSRPSLRAVAGLPESLGGDPPTVNPVEWAKDPDATVARGGTRYLTAKAAQEAREAQAEAARAAAKERADADRASREALTRDGNATRAAIAQQGAASRAQAAAEKREAAAAKEAEKKAEKDAEQARKRQAVVYGATQTLETLDELLRPVTDDEGNVKDYELAPGVSGVVGATLGTRWIPGTQAANAEAAIQRLNARLVVDLIAEMKSQSRTGATGFGALSERELRILEGAAAKLSTNQSDESFRQELKRVRDMVERIVQDQPQAGGQPSAASKADELLKKYGG